MPKSAPAKVGTLGELLTQQLQALEQTGQGFDSVVDIAKTLDLRKQITLVENLFKDLALEQAPLEDLHKDYQAYCREDITAAEKTRTDYIQKKQQLFKQAHLLDNQPLATQAEREEIANKLKALEKKYKKQLEKHYDDNHKRNVKEALNACYEQIRKNLNKQESHDVAWERHLKELFSPPPCYLTHAEEMPVLKIMGSNPLTPHTPSKLDLRHAFETDRDMQHAIFVGFKEGGANNPGEFGARYLRCYQDAQGKICSQIVFCKQATDQCQPNHRENIAEVLAGRLMNRMIGDYAACTYFAIKPNGKIGNPDDIYVASIYFDNLTDTHKAALLKAAVADFVEQKGRSPTPDEQTDLEKGLLKRTYGRIAGRGAFSGQNINNPIWGHPRFQAGCFELMKDTTLEQSSQGKSLMASLLVGNDQIHSENTGIADFQNLPGGAEKAHVVLDFGGAFRRPYSTILGKTAEQGSDFSRVVTPEATADKKYGVSYLLAYPEELRLSKQFIAGIEAIAEFNFSALREEINQGIDDAITCYGQEGFAKHFAQALDINNPDLADPEKTAAISKNFLESTLFARQLSLKEYALQSKLANLKKIKHTPPDFAIDELGSSHALYFLFTDNHKASTFIDRSTLLSDFTQQANVAALNQMLSETLHLSDKPNPDDFAKNMSDILGRLTIFIPKEDTESRFIVKELIRCLKDIKLRAIACDEAYQLIKRFYQKIAKEGLFTSYFLNSLASKDSTGIELNQSAEALCAGSLLEELKLSAEESVAVQQTLQTHPNQLPLISGNKFVNSIKLSKDQSNLLLTFLKKFYTQVDQLIFEDSGNFTIFAAGYFNEGSPLACKDALEAMQFKLTAFLDCCDNLVTALADLPQINLIKELIFRQNTFIKGYISDLLKEIAPLQNYCGDAKLEKELAATFKVILQNTQHLLQNPLMNIQELKNKNERLMRPLQQKFKEAAQRKIVTSETISSTIENTPPLTIEHSAATLGSHTHTPSLTSRQRFQLTFNTVANKPISAEIIQQQINQKPVSDLIEIDQEHLDTIALLAKSAEETFPKIPLFKNSYPFFKIVFSELSKNPGNITAEGLKNVLQKKLAQHNDKIEEIATTLFNTYQFHTRQLQPFIFKEPESKDNEQSFYFPNDIFLRTAFYQVEKFKETISSSPDKRPHIVISEAWDPHYVEAVLLICSLEKIHCDCSNQSDWQVTIDVKKIDAFRVFYEQQFEKIAKPSAADFTEEKVAFPKNHGFFPSSSGHSNNSDGPTSSKPHSKLVS